MIRTRLPLPRLGLEHKNAIEDVLEQNDSVPHAYQAQQSSRGRAGMAWHAGGSPPVVASRAFGHAINPCRGHKGPIGDTQGGQGDPPQISRNWEKSGETIS